jgi:cobyrinic acid a,c-diamide synthase
MSEKVTEQTAVAKLAAYLHHQLTIEELVDWAERAMMEADFEGRQPKQVRDVVARLGVADVRAFGLTWEDCEELLRKLGYSARVELKAD